MAGELGADEVNLQVSEEIKLLSGFVGIDVIVTTGALYSIVDKLVKKVVVVSTEGVCLL